MLFVYVYICTPFISCYPCKFLAHRCNAVLFVVHALFCATSKVEARLSVGFSLSFEIFPGTLCGPTSAEI